MAGLRREEESVTTHWMRLGAAALSLAVILTGSAAVCTADPLPTDAKPLPSAEVRKIYAGKSIIWGYRHGAYFASNGTAISVYTNWHSDTKPREKWTGYTTGTWSVKGNQMCWYYGGVSLQDRKAWGGKSECWKWYRSDSRYFSFHARKPEGKRPATADEYDPNELRRFRSGDRIRVWFNAYKKQASTQ